MLQKNGVLRSKTTGFALPARRLMSAIYYGNFRVLEAKKTGGFFLWRVFELLCALPQEKLDRPMTF